MNLNPSIYRAAKRFLQIFRLVPISTSRYIDKTTYEIVVPRATYSPWSIDEEFLNMFYKIKNYTFIDIYRCYELWTLVKETAKIEGALMEVGVWKGGSGALIAKRASMINNGDTIYLCDTFQGVVKANPQFDKFYKGGEYNDTSEEAVYELLHQIGSIRNTIILKGIFPDETQHLIRDTKFRFCHIDVDVYQSAKDIVQWIWPRLSIGGLIVFDDYGFVGCDGITRFVNELRTFDDRLVIHNLNGHAIVIKL